MNTLSRRRFCLLAGIAPLALPDPADTQAIPSPAALLYDGATDLLRRGRNFQDAIDLLTRAVTIEPTNSKYFLALGCAAASRFTALAWAAYSTDALAKERAEYIDRMRDWQAERDRLQVETPQEFDAAAYDRDSPVEPPARVFPTKDDNRPYRLTPAQRDAQMTDLARAAWEKGLGLTVTPAQKAEAYYVRGWGRRVLQTFGHNCF